jgi:hypothetical protein
MFDCVFQVPLTAAMLDMPHARVLETTISSPRSMLNTAGKSFRSLANAGKSFRSLDNVGGSSPSWNDIVFTLIDTDGVNGTAGHGELGTMTVTHDELIRAYKHTITQTRPIGNKGATLEFRISLSGKFIVSCSAETSMTTSFTALVIQTLTLSFFLCLFVWSMVADHRLRQVCNRMRKS